MSVNIKALKAAIEKIGAIGQDEHQFEAGGHSITIRAMEAREENEVDKWAQLAWEEAVSPEGDRASLADFIDRQRIGTLSHVIIEVDGLDLRGVTEIETGEVTKDGVPIKRPKYLALRDMLWAWSRPVAHLCYLKFGEFMALLETRSRKAIEFDEEEISEEIARLKKRLADLEQIQEGQAERKETPELGSQMREKVVEVGQDADRRRQDMADALNEVRQEQQDTRRHQPPSPALGQSYRSAYEEQDHDPEPQPQRRQPAYDPRHVAPPERPQPQEPERAPEVQYDPRSGMPLPYQGDSMFDPGDPESAIQAETQRLEEFRRQQAAERLQAAQRDASGQRNQNPLLDPGGSLPAQVPQAKQVPHRDALNAQNALINLRGEEVKARPKGNTGELAAVRMPTEELVDRGQTGPGGSRKADPRQLPVNEQNRGATNPNFRRPGE